MSARDWFDPCDADYDPVERAKSHVRRTLPKRFYTVAAVVGEEGGHALALDGRMAKTPAKNTLRVASSAVAEGIAAEWQSQSETIDPATMPLTRLVNSAIDGVASEMAAVSAEILRFAGSDLLCYRALEPAELVDQQRAAWDPVMAWIEGAAAVRLRLAAGIIHAEQDGAALAALGTMIETAIAGDPLRLAALHVATSLTGSAVLALALAGGRLSPDTAWDAAHVDEDFQMRQWGEDAEALKRRAYRRAEFDAAAFVLAATAGE